MSEYYTQQVFNTRHAELIQQARESALAKALPSRPNVLSRLWSRLVAPVAGRAGRPDAAAKPTWPTPAARRV